MPVSGKRSLGGQVMGIEQRLAGRSAMAATSRENIRHGAIVVDVSKGAPTGVNRTGSLTQPHHSAVSWFGGGSLHAKADNARTRLSQRRCMVVPRIDFAGFDGAPP